MLNNIFKKKEEESKCVNSTCAAEHSILQGRSLEYLSASEILDKIGIPKTKTVYHRRKTDCLPDKVKCVLTLPERMMLLAEKARCTESGECPELDNQLNIIHLTKQVSE